mgnify:FL=1
MNKVILSGRIVKDLDLRYTKVNDSSVAVLQNTIAVKNDYKNANGEYDSQFINFVVWRKLAEFLGKYAMKGSQILIEGKITNRSYDKQDGTKAYITEVIAEKVELLGNPKKEEPKTVQEENEQPTTIYTDEIELTDDDLPF